MEWMIFSFASMSREPRFRQKPSGEKLSGSSSNDSQSEPTGASATDAGDAAYYSALASSQSRGHSSRDLQNHNFVQTVCNVKRLIP
jgi:hypothetical protein